MFLYIYLHSNICLCADSDLESGEEDEVQSSDSDTSTGNSVSCPICLLKFKGQAIGFPEVCEHPFCLDCILEWSKVTSFSYCERQETVNKYQGNMIFNWFKNSSSAIQFFIMHLFCRMSRHVPMIGVSLKPYWYDWTWKVKLCKEFLLKLRTNMKRKQVSLILHHAKYLIIHHCI